MLYHKKLIDGVHTTLKANINAKFMTRDTEFNKASFIMVTRALYFTRPKIG